MSSPSRLPASPTPAADAAPSAASRHAEALPAERAAEHPLIANFELTDVVSHLLRRAHFRAEALFADAFQGEDLTPRQKALLITACKYPGATQSQLGEHMALDRNSLADIVNRMVRKGYLRRRRAVGDARAYAVHITQSGFELLQRVLPRDQEVENAIIEALPPEYRALFMKCLRVVSGVASP